LPTDNTFTGTNTFNNDVVIAESGTGDALRITNTGTGNSLVVEDSANPDTTSFVVDATGLVGIGGTPSSAKLFVNANASTTQISTTSPLSVQLADTGGGGLNVYGAGATAEARFIGLVSGGTLATPTATPINVPLATVKAGGHDGTVWTGSKGRIEILAAEQWSATANGTYITLSTTPLLSTSVSERMRIDSTGNVGINVQAPGTKLDVSGNARFSSGLMVNGQGSSNITMNNGVVIGTVAKASAPTGGTGSITITSNDATNQMQGTIALVTDATATNRRLTIGAIEQNVAYRNVSFCEGGGSVFIGSNIAPGQNSGGLTIQGKDIELMTIMQAY
jgi:hypothetical protein